MTVPTPRTSPRSHRTDRAHRGTTAAVAAFVARPRTAASPTAGAVARVLVDTVGVGIAGVATDTGEALLDWIRSEPATGRARIWGTDLCVGPSQAALANGTTAHALDWDDAVPSIPMHPGTVLLPALLARLAGSPADGTRLVHAYDVGSAVFRAVSEALPIDVHYGRGWHNTATSGRLAAVAALAHLIGLDEDQIRHALGIVISSVAATLANFGTMTKPLHAGQAARDAVIAVAIAERGFTAHSALLEEPRGFFALYGDPDAAAVAELPARLEHWEHHWVEDWTLKRHPSCFATHRAIDSALVLRAGLDPEHIEAVTISVPAGATHALRREPPTTGLEGKFSLGYTVARALLTGQPTLIDFTDERVADPRVRRLMRRVTVDRRTTNPAAQRAAGPHTWVEVVLSDGRRLRHGVDVTYGDAAQPLTEEDLASKFVSALAWAGWSENVARRLLGRLTRAPYDAELGWLQDSTAPQD